MLVHLTDKTVALNSPGKLAKALEEKNGLMDLSLLPEMISKSIEGFGVKVKTNDEAARRVLITFIGSGDYGCCDYTYVNPFHSDDHSFDVNGSGMVGISLARRLKEDPREDLSLLVVCGTYSSNWRMVMLAFEREFGEKLSEDLVSEFGGLKSLVIERQNKNISLARDDIEKLTKFFEKLGSYAGFDVKLVFISPEISELSVQQSLMDSLTRLLRFGDELSFDITHSYRIIPILTLCYSQYFGALLNTKIRHIFYGDIQQEQDLNFLNGLKYSQLKDEAVFKTIMFEIRNRVLQGINGRSAVSGIVYEMKNIANLMRYSSAISQFRATGNLMFLLSMMKIELKKRRPDLYRSFINGALLRNFMLITRSCSYLKSVLEELKRGIKDPVMSFLSREITENLSSLPYDADDRTPAGVASWIRYYASQAKMHLDLENIFMSLLFCYEGMHYAGDILWRAGRASLHTKSITAGADGKLIFKGKINSAVEKLFNLALENKSAKAITGFFNDEKKIGGANLAAACFGRDVWQSIKNGRNSIFHLNYAGFSDVDEATEIVKIAVNEITRRSEILDSSIKG